MPKSPKTSAPKAPSDPGAEARGLRIAELEKQIAEERSQAAAKAREVERAMQILRTTMQDLQVEVQRGNEERERLRVENERLHEQLHEARQNLLDMSARPVPDPVPPPLPPPPPPPPEPDPRVGILEKQLEETRTNTTALRQKVVELESEVRRRERDLVEARNAADVLEEKLASRPEAPTPAGPARTDSPTEEMRAALDIFGTPADESAPRAQTAREKTEELAPPPAPPSAPPAKAERSPVPPPAPRRAPPPPREPDPSREPEPTPEPPAAEETPFEPFDDPAPSGESDGLLDIPGIRIEQCVEDGPGGMVFDGREMPTRRAVTVLVLPAVGKLLEGGKLDSLLLARHPNLVAVLAFGVCASGPYLVMERHDGETGDAWVRRIGPLPERTVLAVALEAARGLRQAATSGALHGDLSPASVIVDASGRVRVLGAGLRTVVRPGEDAPLAPEFAAPERVAGTQALDARSDIYSLGAVLWYLLTGSPPPQGVPSPSRGAAAIVAPDVCEVRTDVSEETGRLLRRMLAPEPEQRHRTWDQLLIDLEHRQPGVVSPELRSNLESRARRIFANRPWLLVVVMAVPLLCAFSIYLATRVSSPEDRWAEARDRAERLAGEGNAEAARQIYRRFLQGVGDEAIEAEAARRFEALGTR